MRSDPDPKSCSIQKQNSGMINTPLNGGGADEKITIHRSLPSSRPSWGHPCRMSAVSWAFLIPRSICGVRNTAELPHQLKTGAVCAGDQRPPLFNACYPVSRGNVREILLKRMWKGQKIALTCNNFRYPNCPQLTLK